MIVTTTVTANAPGCGPPSGKVDYRDSTTATVLWSTALSSGMAALTVADFPVGTNTIALSYSGDSNFLTRNATVTAASRNVTAHACHRLRQWLVKKFPRQGPKWSRYSDRHLHAALGLLRLQRRLYPGS